MDVGDLFNYAGLFKRPSGIQRVVYELGHALAQLSPGKERIGFLRHGSDGRFVAVPWRDIAAMFACLTEEVTSRSELAPPITPLGIAIRLQVQAWQGLLAVPQSIRPDRWSRPESGRDAKITVGIQPGDTLLIAGAGWSDPGHAARVIALRKAQQIRVALLVHDIIPLRRPEWFDPLGVARFATWFDGLLSVADRLLAVSSSTAGDVTKYRQERGLAPCPVSVVRLGDGFSKPPGGKNTIGQTNLNDPFALYVSTIEIRKNHALLVETWRVLLDRLPWGDVPLLVFAGREGALTGDLMRQLRANDFLNGKVVLRHAASDADIAALYRECAFTLFPSLYEGWGLPVAESHSFGKPCLASNSTSIPEVGGSLARYFDPLNLHDTISQVENVIRDPKALAAWEAQVRREFQPTPWSQTASMVLAGVA